MSSGSYENIEEVLDSMNCDSIVDIAREEGGVRAVMNFVLLVGCGVVCPSIAMVADTLLALDYWLPSAIPEACA